MPTKKADPREVDELAERLALVLESQRRLGGDAYPPTLARLAQLCEHLPSDDLVKQAAGKRAFASRAAFFRDRCRPVADAPVVLRDSLEDDDEATGLASSLLVYLLRNPKSKKSRAFTAAELKKRLPEALQKPFQRGLNRAFEWGSIPEGIGWIRAGRSDRLFLLEHVQTSGPRPATPAARPHPAAAPGSNGSASAAEPVAAVAVAVRREFDDAFREAFERLDRRNGATNFVKLADLRAALAEFDREQFDAGLNRLRDLGLFALDSHEGLYGSLTAEEREAGLREAGSLLVYASRR